MTDHIPAWNEAPCDPVRNIARLTRKPVDHSPAWALIPWYGRDGLGTPTLDDWRVWADWLATYDTDPDRDAAIAQALRCGWADEVVAVRCVRAYMSVGRPAAMPPMRTPVLPRYDGAEFLGFEAQPTRREMRGPLLDRITHGVVLHTSAGEYVPIEGEALSGWMELDGVRWVPGANFRARLGMRDPAAVTATPSPAARLDGSDRWVNIPTPANARQPRNPRRRGSTGAHGRARR